MTQQKLPFVLVRYHLHGGLLRKLGVVVMLGLNTSGNRRTLHRNGNLIYGAAYVVVVDSIITRGRGKGPSGTAWKTPFLIEATPSLAYSFPVLMDLVEGFKHHVTSGIVNHRVLVRSRPIVFDVGRELRWCVITVCIAWVTTSVFRSWVASKRSSD